MQNTNSPETDKEFLTASPVAITAKTEELQTESQGLTPEQKKATIIIIVVLVLLVISILGSVIYLLNQTTEKVALIRDVFIIFMALESILTGLALVILMVQLARLINLLQNEIKPILDSTNQTVSNLRGTTVFLSDNLVGPVIKLNEYLAGLSQFIQVIGLMRKPPKPK
jgi:hypothetical protein